MSITVSDCLKLPSLRLGKVIAGKNGLNRVVNNVSVLEVLDEVVFDFNKPINSGDMVLTSFYAIKENPNKQCQHLEFMYRSGDSCLVLYYVGIFIKELHPSVIETADRLDFPIIVMPEGRIDFFYNEVIGEVCDAIFRGRASDNDFIDNITSFISRLPESMRNIDTLLRVISTNLKVTILLSDISLNNIYISKWPLSNGITADEVCRLYESASTKGEYCVELTYNAIPIKVFCLPFTAFEFRNFSIYAVDEFNQLTLNDMFKIIEVLQLFSKLWDLNAANILENALIPAIIEGQEEKMRSLADKLKIDIDSINTMIIIRPDFSEKNSKEQLQIKRAMINAVRDCSRSVEKEIIVDTYGLFIICFTMFATSKSFDVEYIDTLMEYLDQTYPDYTISFFANDDNVEDVRKTYLTYSEFVPHVIKIFPHKKDLSYGDMIFARRCLQMITEKDDDYRICQNILEPLVNSSNSQELLETLEVYHLDAECEIKKTSELLFLHRNTVNYRLSRIKAITNFKGGDMLHSYLMHMAIACHRLGRK